MTCRLSSHLLCWLGALVACSALAAAPYDGLIGTAARRYGLEPALVKAVIKCESNFDVEALSSQGAEGLMQLMPATQATLGVSDAFDPSQNIDAGVRYLAILKQTFGTSTPLLLSAYNAGPQAVIEAGYSVPAFAETERYVTCVESAQQRYEAQRFNRLFADVPTTSTSIDTPASPVLAALQVPPSGGRVGQRLLLYLNAWNISSNATHGVVSLTYPEPFLSLLALRTTPDDTTVQLPNSPARTTHPSTAYRFLQSAWPTWQAGEQRTAVLALIPRLPQDIALHLSVLLYDRDQMALKYRWSTMIRIPVQPAQPLFKE
ncbi:MAG: lytic transglycosylase domain-containing protein [Candidatus Tectomicrobia bacterium]|nr:lytic transglycosylase domain-containing protein [Candidatus Tectomicrobia bacterium]